MGWVHWGSRTSGYSAEYVRTIRTSRIVELGLYSHPGHSGSSDANLHQTTRGSTAYLPPSSPRTRRHRTCHVDGVAQAGDLVGRRRHRRAGRQLQTAQQGRLRGRLQRAVRRHTGYLASDLRTQLRTAGGGGGREVSMVRYSHGEGRASCVNRSQTSCNHHWVDRRTDHWGLSCLSFTRDLAANFKNAMGSEMPSPSIHRKGEADEKIEGMPH